MVDIGLFDLFRNRETLDMLDYPELYEDVSERIAMKKLAVQTCTNMIARTMSQSEFRIRDDTEEVKDHMYYRLNKRPNRNTSASMFWHFVIHKLVYENECLIIQNDTNELLIADSFSRRKSANYDDRFENVSVKDYTFERTFGVEDVIYLQYANENLSKFIDSIYKDYGELFGRLIEFQKQKGQIRATVDVDQVGGKSEDKQSTIQKFIDRAYESFRNKSLSIVPQTKGLNYEEKQSGGNGSNVDELNTLTEGFYNQVARALGIPPSLAKGEVADSDNQTRNYMTFCIDPLLAKMEDELDAKLFSEREFLNGRHVSIRRVSHRDVFDVATDVDKLISSGVLNGNELRDALGYKTTDEDVHSKYFVTKNYEESGETDPDEGGDDE